MTDIETRIKPLDPAYHGESNYEVGLEDLLVETKEKLKKMQHDPTITKEQIRIVEENLQTLESLLVPLMHCRLISSLFLDRSTKSLSLSKIV